VYIGISIEKLLSLPLISCTHIPTQPGIATRCFFVSGRKPGTTPTVSVANGRYQGIMSGSTQVSGRYRVSIPAVLMSSVRYSGTTQVPDV
jgi:hypothetical protein